MTPRKLFIIVLTALALGACSGGGPPPEYPNWKGEYFTNLDLSGAPEYVRNDGAINFRWGEGGPGKVGVDEFAIRWSKTFEFSWAVVGTISVIADDRVRVYDNARLLIDEWHQCASCEYKLQEVFLAGKHRIKIEYADEGGEARIEVVFDFQQLPEPTPTLTAVPLVTQDPDLWLLNRYQCEGEICTLISSANEKFVGTLLGGYAGISYNWAGSTLESNLMTWQRFSRFPESKNEFVVDVQGGEVRVLIDNQPRIDWTTAATETVSLILGDHLMQIEFRSVEGESSAIAITVAWRAAK